MFGKLLTVILAMGAVSGVLLVNRQQRLEIAHESAALYRQVVAEREALWAARCEIAARCRPDRVRLAAKMLNETWSPVLPGREMPVQEPSPAMPPIQLAAGR
jgi:hypothetical protein